MPSQRTRKRQYHTPAPSASRRLSDWIEKKASPPSHIKKRPLQYRLEEKVQKANSFETNEVWLTETGELRLGNPETGRIIGHIAG
ncbi:hypothetical protein EXS70_04430 [Candidatus Peribacteria bacterium]|nr:hypothetical protein [Candidatus Peribacteria bacterium]